MRNARKMRKEIFQKNSRENLFSLYAVFHASNQMDNTIEQKECFLQKGDKRSQEDQCTGWSSY